MSLNVSDIFVLNEAEISIAISLRIVHNGCPVKIYRVSGNGRLPVFFLGEDGRGDQYLDLIVFIM